MEDKIGSESLDLFREYIEEREGAVLFRSEHGFITFRVSEDYCLIKDFFVMPEFRDRGEGKELFMRVCKHANMLKCKCIICTVDLRAKNSKQSLSIIISHGFKAVKAADNIICLEMELESNG